MRFGIALPGSGPLSDDVSVGFTARAAEELDYASVWSTSLRQLLVVTAHAETLPVGLLITCQDTSPDGGVGDGSPAIKPGEADEWPLIRRLGSRLRYVGARPDLHGTIRRRLPGAVLLDTSDRLPSNGGHAGADAIDGWSPAAATVGPVPPDWQQVGSSLLLILRIDGTTAGSVLTTHLRTAMRARADEVVVAFSDVRTLDEQLACFADVAERVAALHEPAAHEPG